MKPMDTHTKAQPVKTGLVNLPGTTSESTALVKKLLFKDVTEHHCFLNDQYFHNHLSHHILSLHDLGASIECIQKMYDLQAANQRPLYHPSSAPPAPAEVHRINAGNWTNYLGEANAHMYADYLAFFSAEIATHGVPGALERYVFSPEANSNGTMMLARFFGGILHPMIQAGFGIEFGQDAFVADGLAQATLTTPESAVVVNGASGFPDIKSGASSATLLSLMREVYNSPDLPPMPYHKPRWGIEFFTEWIASQPKLGPTLAEIYAKWTFTLSADAAANDKEIATKVEECMWLSTLILAADGKPGKKPRMDFVMMHFVTGSLLLRAVLDAVREPLHKAQLLQVFVRSLVLYVLMRGRPRIDGALVMSYPAYPAPPKSESSVLGTPVYGSAWLALLNNASAHTEPHVIKAIRTLFYCAQHYGSTPTGAVIGAIDENGQETHKGAAMLDGTLFVRVAGVLTDAIGWVSHGEEQAFWDFRGAWEESWEGN
ncbi:hypothetical protein C8R45DRAFT_1156409 [Mycena sanguinolenta]|nr:hypothetical protein C8R45DRAFT_1156409 [Mycena sanguinolenta]